MDLKEYELQTRFINENMDVLQKYLIWKEFINEDPQIIDSGVKIEAQNIEDYDVD
jgi:hypothetical protein